MVCTIVMDRISFHIAAMIHIPLRPIRIGIETIPNIPGRNLSVSAEPSIPPAKIGNTQNRLGQLDIQIRAFIFEVVMI
jgi:hypothetical protein